MDTISIVTGYLVAHNAHDVERALAALTDDFRFEAVGAWTRSGKHLARQLEEWDAAIHSALAAADFVSLRECVTCTITERNDWFRLAGIDAVHYLSCRFDLRAGKIASITSVIAPESAQAVGQALRAILNWAGQHRAHALNQLMPTGDFVYTGESAAMWLAMLREWRAAA